MADVILKDRDGIPVPYSAAGVKLYNDQGELVAFGASALQSKSATPSVTVQEITPDAGYDALDRVTIGAVTAAIDENIAAENIRQGISILGVDGSYAGVIPSGNADITDTEETDVAGYATARISASERAKIIPNNIRLGEFVLGVYGELRPAPDWTVYGEAYNWTSAWLNTAIPWDTIFPQLVYNNGIAWVGSVLADAGTEFVFGIIFTQRIGRRDYALAELYYNPDDSVAVLPLYATCSGTATIEEEELSVSYSFTAGWNSAELRMPPGGGKATMVSVPGTDASLLAAGAQIAFGDYVPRPVRTLTITRNGTYDVTGYARVIVDIQGGGGENVTVEDGVLCFDGDTAADGITLILDADASVDGGTLIFTGEDDPAVIENETLVFSGSESVEGRTALLEGTAEGNILKLE